MNISLTQLRNCRSILSSQDIEEIAKESERTPALVRLVLSGTRNNHLIEFLCYQKAKAKAEKTLVMCNEIEKKNSQYIEEIKREKELKFF